MSLSLSSPPPPPSFPAWLHSVSSRCSTNEGELKAGICATEPSSFLLHHHSNPSVCVDRMWQRFLIQVANNRHPRLTTNTFSTCFDSLSSPSSICPTPGTSPPLLLKHHPADSSVTSAICQHSQHLWPRKNQSFSSHVHVMAEYDPYSSPSFQVASCSSCRDSCFPSVEPSISV